MSKYFQPVELFTEKNCGILIKRQSPSDRKLAEFELIFSPVESLTEFHQAFVESKGSTENRLKHPGLHQQNPMRTRKTCHSNDGPWEKKVNRDTVMKENPMNAFPLM